MREELYVDQPKMWTLIDGIQLTEKTLAKKYEKFVCEGHNNQKRHK